jgi:hypothetical protein
LDQLSKLDPHKECTDLARTQGALNELRTILTDPYKEFLMDEAAKLGEDDD